MSWLVSQSSNICELLFPNHLYLIRLVLTVACKLKDNKKSHWRGGRCVSHESTTVHETLNPVLYPPPDSANSCWIPLSLSPCLCSHHRSLPMVHHACVRMWWLPPRQDGPLTTCTCIQKLAFWIQHEYSEKLHTSVETYKAFKEYHFNYIHKGKSKVYGQDFTFLQKWYSPDSNRTFPDYNELSWEQRWFVMSWVGVQRIVVLKLNSRTEA